MFVGYLCETMTGTVGPRVDLLGGSSERVLSGIGTWQATVPGSVAMNVPAKWIYPWISSLLVCHVGDHGQEVPWSFGPITSLPNVTQQGPDGDNDMNVQLSGHDFRALLSRRFLAGPFDPSRYPKRDKDGKYDFQRCAIKWTGCSLGTIARYIVQRCCDKPNGKLPISYGRHTLQTNLPRDDGHTRTYEGWNLANNGADKLLDELSGCINGPHIDFRPYYLTNGDSYVDTAGVYMVTGVENDPHIPQTRDYTWDLTRPVSPATVASWDTSAEALYTRSWASGEGAEAEIKLGYWDNKTMADRGFPLLEQINSYHTVSSWYTLESHARADGAATMWPTVQATLNLDPYHADTAPGSWDLGDRVTLHHTPTYSFLDHAYLHLPMTEHVKAQGTDRVGTIFNAHADFGTGAITVKVEMD